MIARKYHAIAFLSILVMLLLLGLQLLGFGFGGTGQPATAAGAAGLVRNSTSSSSSSLASQQQSTSYRHPISYDKLTGATNNQISEILGAPTPQRSDSQLPIDHYAQRHMAQQQQVPPLIGHHQVPPHGFPMNSFGAEVDSFGLPVRNQIAFGAGGGHLMRPMGPPHHHHRAPMQPPPPPPPLAPPPAPMQRAQQQLTTATPSRIQPATNQDFESLPLATSTSVANNTQLQQQQQQQPAYLAPNNQPTYYTPPIFTYGQFPLNEQHQAPPSHQLGAYIAPTSYGSGGQLPPPEGSFSVDEQAARHAQQRLRGDPQEGAQDPNNLLADPLAQERHRQHMLSLAPASVGPHHRRGQFPESQNATYIYPEHHQARPPYASHHLEPTSGRPSGPESRQAPSGVPQRLQAAQPLPPPPPPPPPSARLIQQQQSRPMPTTTTNSNMEIPQCARLSAQQMPSSLEAANSSSQLPVLFCNEDPDYPTSEIMRSIEQHSLNGPIDQLLPQQLVQLLLAASTPSAKANGQLDFQRQLVMDPLQVNVNAALGPIPRPNQEPNGQVWFPTGNYEPMCRSASYMAQPRRAKNLQGQWKLVVNLPGHKYRGVAVSQMVRLEECTRPNSECSAGGGQTATTTTTSGGNKQQMVPRSRCLQHYQNQRLLAWSSQQGLHMDLFRLPSACSCHIRRQ